MGFGNICGFWHLLVVLEHIPVDRGVGCVAFSTSPNFLSPAETVPQLGLCPTLFISVPFVPVLGWLAVIVSSLFKSLKTFPQHPIQSSRALPIPLLTF